MINKIMMNDKPYYFAPSSGTVKFSSDDIDGINGIDRSVYDGDEKEITASLVGTILETSNSSVSIKYDVKTTAPLQFKKYNVNSEQWEYLGDYNRFLIHGGNAVAFL